MRLQGGSPAEDGLSDDVPETPDFLASCDTDSDDDSQYSDDSDDASQDEGSSSVGRAGIMLHLCEQLPSQLSDVLASLLRT